MIEDDNINLFQEKPFVLLTRTKLLQHLQIPDLIDPIPPPSLHTTSPSERPLYLGLGLRLGARYGTVGRGAFALCSEKQWQVLNKIQQRA